MGLAGSDNGIADVAAYPTTGMPGGHHTTELAALLLAGLCKVSLHTDHCTVPTGKTGPMERAATNGWTASMCAARKSHAAMVQPCCLLEWPEVASYREGKPAFCWLPQQGTHLVPVGA